jgi:hypothetical protein
MTDQAERRRVVRNDERVRNGDTSTYLDHAHSDLGGRFAVTERQTITGVVSPSPPPLPANSPWAGSDPVPDEPPLGYAIDETPPCGEPHEFESPTGVPPVSPPVATDDPAAPSGGVVQQIPLVAWCRALGRLLPRTKASNKQAERPMPDRPSAAASIYPHLKTAMPVERVQRNTGSLGEAMYPRPQPPNPYREALLRHLKEANASIDARLQREGRR